MIDLVPPTPALYDAWAACVVDFGAVHMDGSGHHGPMDTARPAFDAYLAERLREADHAWEPPADRVHASYRWMVEGDEVVGFVGIRHRLTPFLLEQGGHVGYAVRPSRRREGHATAALARTLPLCVRLGIARVLVTCAEDNVGSRRTIERNGGVLEDVRAGTLRFWIDAARPPA
ncbi:hypothetical protein GCM10009737_15980 [Nocardioides lentus]|uniref:N-acetyltransferase domain-containing protein n=1 Tax=Nocardioides lentus TaxID=338077 RepID=A0ABN2PBA9_9ACTN